MVLEELIQHVNELDTGPWLKKNRRLEEEVSRSSTPSVEA